jgi:hypothetical protein
MMVDGVVPLGELVRPLGLSRPSTTSPWRREARSRSRIAVHSAQSILVLGLVLALVLKG